MGNLTFKEAFKLLGGAYEKPTYQSKMAFYHAKQAAETRRKQDLIQRQKTQDNIHDIDFYRAEIERWEPMTDRWCFSMNELQKALYLHGELNNIPYYKRGDKDGSFEPIGCKVHYVKRSSG